MKKLVILGVVMLFVVLGLAGISHAQASATLTGTVTLRGFTYPCAGAYVHSNEATFAAKENSHDPYTGTKALIANPNGVYIYSNVLIPSNAVTTGVLVVDYGFQLFGFPMRCWNRGLDSFTFDHPFPFSTPTKTVNVEVYP